MHIQENISLQAHSTMRLGGNARYLCDITTEAEVEEAVKWAAGRNLPIIMIGQGSNIVWRDEGFPGLVLVNKIGGREVLSEDSDSVTIRVGGGEIWDEVVARAVSNGWSGIEFLSLIPGTAGAAPVQNIGAYGEELSSTLVGVSLYDTKVKCFETLLPEACGFGYRTSRFKTTDKGRFLITSITLKLNKTVPQPPFYEALDKYFHEKGISQFTPAVIRDAVIAIRSSKLPDPAIVANNGSFFTNPIISSVKFSELKQKFPDAKGWPTKSGLVKVAAGWLVEEAGFRGVHDDETGMATWPAQALVLVNEKAKTTEDLLTFKHRIVSAVKQKFDITLEQEPELLP